MKKAIFLILILLVAILGVIYFIFAGPEEEKEIKEEETEKEEVSKEEAIKSLFASKYSESASNISITIEKENGNYVRGIVEFGEGGPGQAGGFLAVKTEEGWELVYDGNGAVPCSDIELYDFPTDIIGECFDEETGAFIER